MIELFDEKLYFDEVIVEGTILLSIKKWSNDFPAPDLPIIQLYPLSKYMSQLSILAESLFFLISIFDIYLLFEGIKSFGEKRWTGLVIACKKPLKVGSAFMQKFLKFFL